ncbi:hypothetical protein DPSP01_013612 [Paraphaeosphaeria sporulosa]
MRLDQIPVDVLNLIFSNLCYHCQRPGNFVNADEYDTVEDKRSLARLCRTSKAICTVVQPILYHYYATGNFRKAGTPYRGHWGKNDVEVWDYNFLPQFLRTIIARPDLAERVKSLQIILGRERFSENPPEATHPDLTETMSLLLNMAKERHLLPWRLRKDNLERYSADTSLNLEELFLVVLQCTINVHTLLLAWPYGFREYLETLNETNWTLPPLLTFPSLRTLGVIRASHDFWLRERGHFFNAAFNVDTLYVCDGGGWSTDDHHNDIMIYPVARTSDAHLDCEQLGLLRLRKLSLNSRTPTDFMDLMFALTNGIEELEVEQNEKFPGIEDLTYYWTTWESYSDSFDEALQVWSKTLKRLCLSYIQPSKFEEIDRDRQWDPEDEYEYRPNQLNYDSISSLSMFPLLVDITIDLRSIYRETDPEVPYRLVSFLPPVIERLRITYVFREITKELHQLGAQAPRDFLHLKAVVVGIPYKTETECHEGLENMKASGVDDLFESHGVSFSWTVDFMGADLRTMVPGMTVGLPLIPLPGI